MHNYLCLRYVFFVRDIISLTLNLTEVLGESEKIKAEMSLEIESLRKEVFEKDSSRENIYEEIKSKVQHWKVLLQIFLSIIHPELRNTSHVNKH